jgi:hypothetical protein
MTYEQVKYLNSTILGIYTEYIYRTFDLNLIKTKVRSKVKKRMKSLRLHPLKSTNFLRDRIF